MGDHRASIKIEAEFHGVKKECDMWINWSGPNDSRLYEFFDDLYTEGMRVYDDLVYESQKAQREKQERETELAELKRLKEKYEQPTPRNEGEQE